MGRVLKDSVDRPLLHHPPAYMTSTSSLISATTPRSWVMSTIAELNWVRKRRIRSRIWACVVTSSAVVRLVGDQQIGSLARAMAIMIRCRMPPDSSNG